MTKKKNTEKRYRVVMASNVKVDQTVLRAGTSCVVSGAVLEEIKGSVASYNEV